MLRLLDTRSGEPTVLAPAHPGELRLLVSVQAGTELGKARGYLVADLVRRIADRRGLLVTVCDLAEPAGDLASLRADGAALNVHPPEHTLPPSLPPDELAARLSALFPGGPGGPAAPGGPGGPGGDGGDRHPLFDLLVYEASDEAAPAEAAEAVAWSRLTAAPGPVTPAISPSEVTQRGLDPLALRLALLGFGYRQPARLGWEALRTADKTLLRWREQVAAWARSPSTAMSRRYADAITAAFDDDLDTPSALREVGAMEGDAGEADGTKFETFAAADRLLGLDLARDVGR